MTYWMNISKWILLSFLPRYFCFPGTDCRQLPFVTETLRVLDRCPSFADGYLEVTGQQHRIRSLGDPKRLDQSASATWRAFCLNRTSLTAASMHTRVSRTWSQGLIITDNNKHSLIHESYIWWWQEFHNELLSTVLLSTVLHCIYSSPDIPKNNSSWGLLNKIRPC